MLVERLSEIFQQIEEHWKNLKGKTVLNLLNESTIPYDRKALNGLKRNRMIQKALSNSMFKCSDVI